MNEKFSQIQVPEDRALGIEKFILQYLEHHLLDEHGQRVKSARFHRDIYYVHSHPEEYNKIICIAPRGFSKSVIFDFFGVLYDLLVNKVEQQLVIGSSQDLVNDTIRKIKYELANNEALIADFGEMSTEGKKGETWREDKISVANGCSVVGIGYQGRSRGLHPKKIVIDDLETDESARSEDQCRKVETWLKATIEPMVLSEKPIIYWVGTLLTHNSVLNKAFRGDGWDDSWFRMKYGALDCGESIWPNRFPVEWLEAKRRAMGTALFNAEYMNEPAPSLNPIVKQNWLQFYEVNSWLPTNMFKVLSVDPAISQKERADKSAFCVVGADMTPHFMTEKSFLLHIHEGHYSVADTVKIVFDLYKKYQPDIVRIENVAYQEALVQAVEREAADKSMYIPIERIKPDRDKYRRLAAVSPIIENGSIFFPKGDPTTAKLIEQLLTFPETSHDDLLDSFVYCLDAIKYHWMSVSREYSKEQTFFRDANQSSPAISEIGY